MIEAHPRDPRLGYVADVAGVDTGLLDALIGGGFIPVVAPLARGDDGSVYNVNADTVAGQVAAALGAEKLVYLTDVEGLYRHFGDDGSLLSSINSHRGRGDAREWGSHRRDASQAAVMCCRHERRGAARPHPRRASATRPAPRDIHPGRDRDHGGAGPSDMTVMDRAERGPHGHLPAPVRGLRAGVRAPGCGTRTGSGISTAWVGSPWSPSGTANPAVAAAVNDQIQRWSTSPTCSTPCRWWSWRSGSPGSPGWVGSSLPTAVRRRTRRRSSSPAPGGGTAAARTAIEVVSLLGSFHGRTMGALAATGQPTLQAPFAPMPNGFTHVPAGEHRGTGAGGDFDDRCGDGGDHPR